MLNVVYALNAFDETVRRWKSQMRSSSLESRRNAVAEVMDEVKYK